MGAGRLPGTKIGELQKISSVERDVLNRGRVDLPLDHGLGELHRPGRLSHADRGSHHRDLQFGVQGGGASRLSHDSLDLVNRKADGLNSQVV